MTTDFTSDITLGERYRDQLTGFEGFATSLTFYIHACERVTLEFVKDGEIKFDSFDAPRLVHLDSGEVPTTQRTGGPGGRENAPPRTGDRR